MTELPVTTPEEALTSALVSFGLDNSAAGQAVDFFIESGMPLEEAEAFYSVWGNFPGLSPVAVFRLHARGITPRMFQAATDAGAQDVSGILDMYTLHQMTLGDIGTPQRLTDELFSRGEIYKSNPDWVSPDRWNISEELFGYMPKVWETSPWLTMEDVAEVLSENAGSSRAHEWLNMLSVLNQAHENYPTVSSADICSLANSFLSHQWEEQYLSMVKVVSDSRLSLDAFHAVRLDGVDLDTLAVRVDGLRRQVPQASSMQLYSLVSDSADLNPELISRAREGAEITSKLGYDTENWETLWLFKAILNGSVSTEAVLLASSIPPESLRGPSTTLELASCLQNSTFTTQQVAEFCALPWRDDRSLSSALGVAKSSGQPVGDIFDFLKSTFQEDTEERNSALCHFFQTVGHEYFRNDKKASHSLNVSYLSSVLSKYPTITFDDLTRLAISGISADSIAACARIAGGVGLSDLTYFHRLLDSSTPDKFKQLERPEWEREVSKFLTAFNKSNPDGSLATTAAAWRLGLDPESSLGWRTRRRINELIMMGWSYRDLSDKDDKTAVFLPDGSLSGTNYTPRELTGPSEETYSLDAPELEASNTDPTLETIPTHKVTLSSRNLPAAPGPVAGALPSGRTDSSVEAAMEIVDWSKDRYGQLMTDFDTFFNMPALLDRSFEPLQAFIAALVEFQDVYPKALKGEISVGDIMNQAKGVKRMLETAVAEASQAGMMALVNRPDGADMLNKLTRAKKTLNQAESSDNTPQAQEAFRESFEEQLAQVADTLGGPGELKARLELSAAAHNASPAIQVKMPSSKASTSRSH